MSESERATPARRPWHLWLVGILGMLWSSVGCVDYLMTQTNDATWLASFTPEQLAWFHGLPSWVVACWAVGVWGGFVGCLLLLLRNRLAVWVLLASFLGAIATTVQNYGLSNGYEIMGGAGALIFSGVIVLIALGLLLYAVLMKKRGVLV